ncbi:MAG: ECF transporter S component [Clostridia bacterium]|nr:ECF transporter S component [Clostridia bacterium]
MLLIRNNRLRRILGILIPFVIIPAIVIAFSFGPGRKHYALSSLLITLAAIVVFSCGFERRKTGTRRLIIVAVMTALSVIGRFIFTAIPAFKPITAIVVITAVYLGGEAGFLTGALSALISNFYFGQGPWTPFQMLSWGMIGLIAGLLCTPMKKSRIVLSLYGIFAGCVYSFIMDIWSVVWYNGAFNMTLYTAALATALPHTIMYAVSNVVFLNLIARPFGEKLSRIKIKYGC